MKKTLFSVAFIGISFLLKAQCTSVSTINDDFESYTAGTGQPLPTCWSQTGSAGPVIGVRNSSSAVSGTKYISIYSFFTANATVYIVSPKLSTIDGSHYATFQISADMSDVTVSYGTMSDSSNAATFTQAGAATLTTGQYTPINTGNIPATTDQYFAIKIDAPTMHSSIKIDDFVWDSNSSTSIATYDKLSPVSIYPNPVTGNTLSFLSKNNFSAYGISVYTTDGRLVLREKLQSNLSVEALSNGVYIVVVNDTHNHYVQRLVIQR